MVSGETGDYHHEPGHLKFWYRVISRPAEFVLSRRPRGVREAPAPAPLHHTSTPPAAARRGPHRGGRLVELQRGGRAGRTRRAPETRTHFAATELKITPLGLRGSLVGTGRCPPPNPPRQACTGPPDPTKSNPTAASPRRPPRAGGSYKWAGARPSSACAVAGSDLRDESNLFVTTSLVHPVSFLPPPPPDRIGSARPPRAARRPSPQVSVPSVPRLPRRLTAAALGGRRSALGGAVGSRRRRVFLSVLAHLVFFPRSK